MCSMCFVLQSYHYIGRLTIGKLLGNVGICRNLWEFVGICGSKAHEADLLELAVREKAVPKPCLFRKIRDTRFSTLTSLTP